MENVRGVHTPVTGNLGTNIKGLVLDDNSLNTIYSINIESHHEIELLKDLPNKPRISLRINPDMAANTHPYICLLYTSDAADE